MKGNYPELVFLNGEWLRSARAQVSVFDRGFLLGDGMYEVIPFYGGNPFLFERHIRRLQDGLVAVGITYNAHALTDTVMEAISRSHFTDGIVYIQVTRGVAPRTHYFPADVSPTVLLYARPFAFDGFENKLIEVILSDDFRWLRCNIKSISLMANVLANEAAHQAGVAENVFVREGLITEGSHTSIFFVRDGILFTHPNGPHILPGITRDEVITIAKEIGITVNEQAVHVQELPNLSEAFLTGTTMQVTAIGSIWTATGSLPIGSGTVGPITRQIQKAFIARRSSST